MSTASRFLLRYRSLLAGASNISPSNIRKATTSAAASKELKGSKEKKGASSGIMKTMPLSPTLQSVVGMREASRVEVIKKVWEYIKLHKLQNPSDKREILCDAKLKKVFEGKDKVGFLEIGKLLTPHFIKAG